jgi:hypothetical protein
MDKFNPEKIILKNGYLQSEKMSQHDSQFISNAPFSLPLTNQPAGQNGRVSLGETQSAGGFLQNPSMAGFGHRTQVEENPSQALLRGNWSENTLSQAFFGPENVALIQQQIKRTVYEESGPKRWVIDDQSVDEIQIVMRSLYLQYAKNQDNDIPGQVRELNRLVINWCVPRILSEIGMYHYYLNDISKLPVPLEHAISLSSAGTKSLPFRKFM